MIPNWSSVQLSPKAWLGLAVKISIRIYSLQSCLPSSFSLPLSFIVKLLKAKDFVSFAVFAFVFGDRLVYEAIKAFP